MLCTAYSHMRSACQRCPPKDGLVPRYHISTLLTSYGRSVQRNTKGMDYTLTVFTLDHIRRRVVEIETVVSRFRKNLIRSGKHLHVKVQQEVTVVLPDNWVPRRQRMQQQPP